MPTGDVDLVIDLGQQQIVVSGPSTRAFLLGTGGPREAMGAVFRIGASALLEVPLSELRDRRVLLHDLWGAVARALLDQSLAASSADAKLNVLERVLSARLAHVTYLPHPVVGRAADEIGRNPEHWRMTELAEALGLSGRRLEQVFRADLGLTPKAYQRLHRFRRALVSIDRAAKLGWAAFALERGYYDQSHFIGEFRAHSGLTPSEYMASRGTELNHVPIRG